DVKKCLDPYNIFNPGVLLNDDSEIHLKNLKTIPAVNPLIDKCIECGFCEKSCPSKDLTLTPRQRITVYRLLESSEVPNPELARLFEYSGEATCATDGLCALACPVEINTGILIKELRFKNKTPGAEKIAEYLSANMDTVTSWGRFVLNVVHFKHKLLGTSVLGFFAEKAYKWSGKRIPLWNPQMPKGADLPPILSDINTNGNTKKHTDNNVNKNTVVYFPTCINRTMGNSADNADKKSLMQASVDLLEKGGFTVVYPDNLSKLCCGMAYASKGFRDQAEQKENELNSELLKVSKNGKYPVFVDMSPCLHHMKETLDPTLKLYEPVEFIHDFLLDKINFRKKSESITIHNTCTTIKMGLQDKFLKVAQHLSEEVIVPEKTGCCGWAGDRGFTHPELNASALKDLKSKIPKHVHEGYS
ncbi:MAG: 4Fe-4S dicluster domain-containing protein, partial [Candidatus Marinimicrobia bacterium]|nr:4Fe-4S dicluster domain-containing protein [Candidatus Neomarinimicrobiota bacterium]